MKKYLFLFTFLVFAIVLSGQNYAGTWLLGFDSSTGLPEYGGSTIQFTEDSLLISSQSRGLNFLETGTSMSDSLGNLLFYTNGVAVVNAAGDTLQNGGGISPSVFTRVYKHTGVAKPQTTLALPAPGDSTDTQYYLFSSRPLPSNTFVTDRVDYHLIDMAANNGNGALIQKNELALSDTTHFLEPSLTAVRHGNGRDWWLFVPSDTSAYYHRLLVSPEGIGEQQTQYGDFFQTQNSIDLGQNVFSPNGEYFIDHDILQGVRVFNFDRCTGELSNMRHIFEDLFFQNFATGGGTAVSGNSRFVYFSAKNYIYQYDLEAEDLNASKTEVAVLPEEGFKSPYTPYFYRMQLGLDSKIYINSTNGVDVLHVIHEPNLAGLDCNVELNAVQLPHWNFRSLPTFPNYRLYDWDNSPCDTLNINRIYTPVEEVVEQEEFEIFPNPASDVLQVRVKNSSKAEKHIQIYDLTGRLVKSFKMSATIDNTAFTVADLPKGLYLLNIFEDTLLVHHESIVIIR
jgi:hypothetical protein